MHHPPNSHPLGKDSFPLSRRFAYTAIAAGLGGNSALADDVALVTNELVAASYLACADTVELGIELRWDHATVIVRDDRPPGPPPRSTTPASSFWTP